MCQEAMAYYRARDFEESQALFEEIRLKDPYRLENMESYSNILYVKEDRATLSYLAHSAVQNDKYRAETCCIIGNYYSSKQEHKKSIIYFKRALRLDPNFLAAWTLMVCC